MVGNNISSWESKGLSNEKISPINTSSFNFSPTQVYNNAIIKQKFSGDSLKQDDNATYNLGPIVIIYTVYKLIPGISNTNITLKNCVFGAVEVRNHSDIDVDKYTCPGYGTGFDSRGSFTHPSGGYDRNIIIFGADMSSSVHANNKTRSILVLGKDFIQEIDGTNIYAEKRNPTNFTVHKKKICLSLHYNGGDSYLFVNGKEIYKFKAKDSNILSYPLCLGTISKEFSPSNIRKTGLNGYFYDFIVDYWAIANDKILDIHKYLMDKNNII